MKQETGETRNAIVEDVNKQIEEIVIANKNQRDPYWIVLFAKHFKGHVQGMPTLVQHIKAYQQQPNPQLGMIFERTSQKSVAKKINSCIRCLPQL